MAFSSESLLTGGQDHCLQPLGRACVQGFGASRLWNAESGAACAIYRQEQPAASP